MRVFCLAVFIAVVVGSAGCGREGDAGAEGADRAAAEAADDRAAEPPVSGGGEAEAELEEPDPEVGAVAEGDPAGEAAGEATGVGEAAEEGSLSGPDPLLCDSLLNEMADRAARTQACEVAADCGCYPALPFTARLGVARVGEAHAIGLLAQRVLDERCPLIEQQVATPPVCAPTCVDGECALGQGR